MTGTREHVIEVLVGAVRQRFAMIGQGRWR
jgi:hypothetical protein